MRLQIGKNLKNVRYLEASVNGFKTLIYEKKDHIAYVTLNRPQALNVYNIQMRDDLYRSSQCHQR